MNLLLALANILLPLAFLHFSFVIAIDLLGTKTVIQKLEEEVPKNSMTKW